MKELSFKSEKNFDKVLLGLNRCAEAVCLTLGPKGNNVMIDDPMLPHITNDGHTIANSISFTDRYENLGAWVVRNTSAQTNDDAGDGTTTTAVLLKEIVNEALKRPENPMMIKNSLQEACVKIVEKIKEQAKPIKIEDVYKVALISSEIPEIAALVSTVIKQVGKDGVIVVEESKTFETSSEVLDGYQANVGFTSPYFANDATGAKATYENVPVLVTQKKIQTVQDIVPLFEQLQKKNIGQIVIVCEDIDPQMLGIMVMNKIQGKLNILVIKASGSTLEDIAAVVGARTVSDSTGVTFQDLKVEIDLGYADKIICSEKKTLFVANSPYGLEHANRLKGLMDNNTNQYEKEIIKKRIAQLTGGIAVIRVGATTDLERVYKKHKTDDTVAAVKAALAEGIVEGGGMCLWRIAERIMEDTVGEEILVRALKAPLRRIIENAGGDYSDIIVNLPKGQGYDAKTDAYRNMLEAEIVDPAKVVRVALENACSNAALFVTTFAVIVDAKEDKKV
jgi:chaperonin GroEL